MQLAAKNQIALEPTRDYSLALHNFRTIGIANLKIVMSSHTLPESAPRRIPTTFLTAPNHAVKKTTRDNKSGLMLGSNNMACRFKCFDAVTNDFERGQ